MSSACFRRATARARYPCANQTRHGILIRSGPRSIGPPCELHRRQNFQFVAIRGFFFFEEKPNNRIRDILVNPDGVSSEIKPGNLVDKFYKKTGNTRTIPTELAYGYFWMIKDLSKTGGKPIISNPHLIPAKNAQHFPSLDGVQTLDGKTVQVPQYFLRKNRSQDENAQCTLVAVSCRDHGFQMLKSWTEPFQSAFVDEERVDVFYLNIYEGWVNSNILKPVIKKTVKNNTQQKDYNSTLLVFRNDLEDFRDVIRMHNVMSGYVFLLDGIGRVRFAGSGEATAEEVQRLIGFAKELTPLVKERANVGSTRRSIKRKK